MSFKIRNVYKQQVETNLKDSGETLQTEQLEEKESENTTRRKAQLPASATNKVASAIRRTDFEKGAEQDSY